MRYFFIIFLLLCFAIPSIGQPLSTNQVHSYIISLSQKLNVILDEKNSPDVRARKLRILFDQNFAIDDIAKSLLSHSWVRMTRAQRLGYLKAFHEFILYRYSRQIGCLTSFVGHYRVDQAVRIGHSNQFLINTIVHNQDSSSTLGWRVTSFGHRLKIIDILVEGLSLVENERTIFSGIIREKGVNALIGMLREKNKLFHAQSIVCS